MKLVGGDSGRYEREEYVDEVLLAPSERPSSTSLFDRAPASTRSSTTPRTTPTSSVTITVTDEPVEASVRGASSRRCTATPQLGPSERASTTT